MNIKMDWDIGFLMAISRSDTVLFGSISRGTGNYNLVNHFFEFLSTLYSYQMVLTWLAQDHAASKGVNAGYHIFPRPTHAAEAT